MQNIIITIVAVMLVGCEFGVNKPRVVSVDPIAGAKAPDISIHDAARDGNIEAVKQHLDSGAGVNGKDEDGYTLLDWAIFTKDTETAEILRKHGGKTAEELKATGN